VSAFLPVPLSGWRRQDDVSFEPELVDGGRGGHFLPPPSLFDGFLSLSSSLQPHFQTISCFPPHPLQTTLLAQRSLWSWRRGNKRVVFSAFCSSCFLPPTLSISSSWSITPPPVPSRTSTHHNASRTSSTATSLRQREAFESLRCCFVCLETPLFLLIS